MDSRRWEEIQATFDELDIASEVAAIAARTAGSVSLRVIFGVMTH